MIEEFDTLKRGDGIWVRFGSRGRQYAVVHGWTPSGNLRAMKWSAVGAVWKGPIRIARTDFLWRSEVGGGDRAAPKTATLPPGAWLLRGSRGRR